MGNREDTINKAISRLKETGIAILACSTIIETDPVGGPRQSKFLNAVVKIQTDLTPEQLLLETQAIENQLGRVREILNGPRTMDIDILLYDEQIVKTQKLTIPHPRMLERDFVLTPLREIAPELTERLIHARH